MDLFGAVEAGGTKFVCGIGTGPDDLATTRIPTISPNDTIAEAIAWLGAQSQGRLRAVGIGSFGPVDLNPHSPSHGFITSTPKAAWRNFDLAGSIRKGLGVPVHIDTDVNAAVLAETRWGGAQGVSDCIYVTVGTGIGGGAMVAGRLLHGLTHPEMGHVRIPQDFDVDPFSGICPYHGNCLEGLASGPAIEARWGLKGENLPPDHRAWALEAKYLAYGIANYVCTLSPERILAGGGVMRQSQLFAMVRAQLERILGGYVGKIPAVVPAQLGERAGVLGALALALTHY
ncbi:MAG TPA: ROK family protein [Bryobacteraceae bacterium]|nr:ROK family protein [Bryobacteraceae bacterium]